MLSLCSAIVMVDLLFFLNLSKVDACLIAIGDILSSKFVVGKQLWF